MWVAGVSLFFKTQVLRIYVPNFQNLVFKIFNVFSLVNTWHAFGFSVFLMVDTLTSIRCHL